MDHFLNLIAFVTRLLLVFVLGFFLCVCVLFFFFFGYKSCGILSSQPGIKPDEVLTGLLGKSLVKRTFSLPFYK